MCSNAVYEGGLVVRVCSQRCRDALVAKEQGQRTTVAKRGISSADSNNSKTTSSKRFRPNAGNDDGLNCSEAIEDGRKKYFFTAANDWDLLREILSVQPFAAKHGTITARYHDVADNLNEHWGTELSMRTVKEHLFLLLRQFKTTDCEYCKKSGGDDEYIEHKQLLQDITDVIESAKKTKRTARKPRLIG
ncbi:hypothetical protein V7S43_010636 [Phytophthora oleae]|uniref:Uncharacterized protein n=1 Tax=Phytophthora oleae TaxID=2107226 RepID=A0ABD3FD07_9STRA